QSQLLEEIVGSLGRAGKRSRKNLGVRNDHLSLPPAQVTLNDPTLIFDDSVLSRPGDIWPIITNVDPQGTTTGFFRVQGQPIDGVIDSVEFSAFTFTPDAIKA